MYVDYTLEKSVHMYNTFLLLLNAQLNINNQFNSTLVTLYYIL